MPDITISLTAAQVARVRTALGVSTVAEVSAILRQYLRSRVLDEELISARKSAEDSAINTVASEGW